MTDEEKLCEISAVLRKHNKPQGGLSHAQALYYIRKIANADDRPRINAHWNDNGLHERRDKMTDFEKLEKRIDKLEDMLLDILGAFSADAFEEAQLDKVIAKYGEIKREVECRGE